jgi:hypothetical protein
MGVEEVPGYPDGDKRPGFPCLHLAGTAGHSCSIYAGRPYPCRQFLCLWRGSDKLLPENLWPARVGFVVALGGTFGDLPTIITVHPDPLHPNSWRAPRHKELFWSLARKFNAIVCIGQAELAQHIFSPRGNEYSRERHPHLFKEDGKLIGLPEGEFLPGHPTKTDLVRLLFDV